MIGSKPSYIGEISQVTVKRINKKDYRFRLLTDEDRIRLGLFFYRREGEIPEIEEAERRYLASKMLQAFLSDNSPLKSTEGCKLQEIQRHMSGSVAELIKLDKQASITPLGFHQSYYFGNLSVWSADGNPVSALRLTEGQEYSEALIEFSVVRN
jgi:hypothetical protein